MGHDKILQRPKIQSFSSVRFRHDDLSLFEPLTSPEARDGTSYFELHPKELPRPHSCWLPGSFFVSDVAFDFFAKCFHSASESFDYYAFQRFGEPEIARLAQELDGFLCDIEVAPSRERLFSRHLSIFTPAVWSDIEQQALAHAVRQCGKKMLSFVQSTTQESQCLWVLGM